MKRILITGATGFLGQHLTKALTERGDEVVALVRDFKEHLLGQRPPTVVIGSFDQVERAIAEYECNVVVHLAAQTQVSTAFKHPVGTFETNIEGTWKVLEACRRQLPKKMHQIIIASSDKCFGDGPSPYTDDQLLKPHGIYGTSKACADMIADAYRQEYSDMRIATTRCGNLYGPWHTNWSTLIPGTIRSILHGERPVLRSTGGPKRDFLFVEDAVDAYMKLIDEPWFQSTTRMSTTTNQSFNIGTGIGTSALDVVNTILRLMGSNLAPDFAGAHGPGSGGVEIQEQVLFSSAMARLDWTPKHTLEQGLQKTIEWYRKYFK